MIAAPTHAAMTDGLTSVAEDLRARGYRRSELSMLHVTQLSATATLASGVAVRYKANAFKLTEQGYLRSTLSRRQLQGFVRPGLK